MTSRESVLLTVLGLPVVCLMILGAYLQWQRWQIYHRIGDYSIGLVTFFLQIDYPGVNFPGPNILEARIAALSGDLRSHIQMVRRRVRYSRWAILSYVGYFFTVLLLSRHLGF